MIHRLKNKVISIVLVMVMAVSVFAVGQVNANAAESSIMVTIADVVLKYKDSKAVLDLINDYRTQKQLSTLEMDEKMMEKAFTRAAELSVYASVTRPDGSQYMDNYAQLIGYNILSNASIVNTWSTSASQNTLYSSSYQSVGVGVAEVCGYKYVCVLFSTSASTGMDTSLYTKSNTVVNKTIYALPSVLSNVRTGFTNNMQLYCGASINAYLYVTNKLYTSVGAYLTADNMNVTIENEDSFIYTYNKIQAIYPGQSLITITSKQSSSVTASATLKAVASSFDNCSFASIPDQYYTGKAIYPNISIKNAVGDSLALGTDYLAEYQNNTQIGTATIVITGIGKYAGQTKKLTFNIILNSSEAFSINASVSPASILTGSSATISVSQSGGVTPIKYTYAYAAAGSSNWTTITSNSTNASCVFKPTSGNTYNIKVTAVDSGNRTASQTVSLKVETKMTCSVSFDKSSYSLGDKVVITATQQGGVSPTYAFFIKAPSSADWTTLQDFNGAAAYTYLPKNPGEYTVLVKFKSANGQSDEVYKSFTISGNALANNSTVSASSVSLGKSVTLNGKAANGAGSYQYAYYYKLSSAQSWSTIQAFGSKTSVSFTPSTADKYDVCIKVKDATSNIVKKYFTVTCTQAFNNTSTLSAAKINLGGTVTVNASSNSSKTCTYAVWYHTKGTTGWSTVQNYSSNAKIAITPTKSGTFEVCVRVKDSTGAIAIKYLNFTVNPKLVNSSKLSASSIATGSSVTVTCAGSGGAGGYTYLVQYRKSGASSWTVKQNYSSNTSVSIPFTSAGTYEIGINVKDSLGSVVSVTKTLTVKTAITSKLTLSKTSIVCGQTNTASVSASGGTGGFTYAFYYKKSTAANWIEKQNFSSSTKVDMKPSAAGAYDVCVKVKDSSGTVQKTYAAFTVTEAVTVKATLSSSTIIRGQSTTITATASKGSGTGYTYAIFMRKSGSSSWTTKQDFKSNAKLAVTPAYDGTYEVCVKAKDSIGGLAKTYLTITVNPSVTVKATLSSSTIIRGQSTTVTATASKGSGTGYTYAIFMRKSGSSSWTTKQDFKSNAKLAVTPAYDGTYEVCVKAKDSIGGLAKTYLTITVKPSVENTSKISATSIKLKSSVTVTASAKNGSGSYTYAVLYKKKADTKWTQKQDFSTNASVKITPAAATTYDICVKAKDSIGGISKKYFTVTVTS